MNTKFEMTDDAFWKKCYMIALKSYLSPTAEGAIMIDTAERACKFAAHVANLALDAGAKRKLAEDGK